MIFTGIEPAELDEVRRLNARFLQALKRPGSLSGAMLSATLDDETGDWFGRADSAAIAGLARAPYFLFRLDQKRCAQPRNATVSLFAVNEEPEAEILLLGLCFVWQLARRDGFSVRVLTGAAPQWCDWLTRVPYASLTERVRAMPAPLAPVLIDHPTFWPALVSAVRQQQPRQLAAIQSVGLQHLLERQSKAEALAQAARSLGHPERRLADR